jgi:hypothetical protein
MFRSTQPGIPRALLWDARSHCSGFLFEAAEAQ